MKTPCDYEDFDGTYHCPYIDTYMGSESEMCRICCGLGVDENNYPEESEAYDD